MSSFNNKNFFKSLSIINHKTPFYLKFNKYTNYFFLTNNFTLLSNYSFFYIFNDNCYNLLKFNYNFFIKKNNFFFFKNLLKFRKYVKIAFFLNKFKLKFNTFFKNIFLNNLKVKNKNFNFFIKNQYYFNNLNLIYFFIKRFYTNQSVLIGNLISPHYINLFSKKKWIRRNNNYYFILNKFLNKNKIKKKFLINNKKYILNSFFYLNKNLFFNNYSTFSFLIKNNIPNPLLKKNNYDFFLSRPYSFLNNFKVNKNFKKYSNFLIINLYKKYNKFFNLLRRVNISYKIRTKNSFIFKNFLSFFKTIFKHFRGKNFLNSKRFFNWFSFFKNKNNNFYLTKKSKKRYFSYLWLFSFSFKTKINKRNKFFKLNKFYLNKNLENIRLFKKTKKGNLFLKTFKILKKSPIFVFIKINWSNNNFFSFFKYFIFFNFFIFFKKSNYINFIWKSFSYNLFKNKKNLFIFNNDNKSLIIAKLKKPFFFSKNKTNFILNKHSFIFINNFYMLYNNSSNVFYNLKKIIFSFPYKNELQRYILRKYSKLSFSIKFTNLKSNKFFFNKEFFFSLKDSLFNFSYFDSFFNKKNEVYSLLLQNPVNKPNWSYFSHQSLFAFNSEKDNINFNIKRVKFKPGYMNIWRDSRSILKTSLMLKIKYQYKLTNYLSKYKKFINFKTFLFMEMRLFNILIKSRLFNDSSLLNLFLKNNLVYVNGLSCSNSNFQLFSGDFIQLIINLKYYILYRWFSNLSLKKKNKLKKVLRKKSINFLQSDEKKKSYLFPKWVIFYKNSIDDVSNFLEIDYFTLSIFILYEPFTWNDLNSYNLIDQRFNIVNLYNWKYIT